MPPSLSPGQLEYNQWHNRLGHLSRSQMQELVKQGKLPKCLLDCQAPVCPACLFPKQTKCPWQHKNSNGHGLRSLVDAHPGSLTFAYQMITATTGKLTYRRFCAATVFVDSYSDCTHIYLHEDLTKDSTLDSKLSCEICAHSFGVQVKGYHADNGRFADSAWNESCDKLHQNSVTAGLEPIIKMVSLNGESRIFLIPPVLHYCMLYTSGPRELQRIYGHKPCNRPVTYATK